MQRTTKMFSSYADLKAGTNYTLHTVELFFFHRKGSQVALKRKLRRIGAGKRVANEISHDCREAFLEGYGPIEVAFRNSKLPLRIVFREKVYS